MKLCPRILCLRMNLFAGTGGEDYGRGLGFSVRHEDEQIRVGRK